MTTDSAYWGDGVKFHRTAVGAQKRREVFTPEIVYNLLAMAIEKYFMAFFEDNHTMPDNHTFTDLMNSANRIRPLPIDLAEDLTTLEGLQDVCPIFEDYQRHEPTESQLTKMYYVTDRIREYCRATASEIAMVAGEKRGISFAV